MGLGVDLDKAALPIAGTVIVGLWFVITYYPLVLLGIAGALTAIFVLAKNKPCLDHDVKSFFAGFHIGGHRGSPHHFPENSLAGFEQAKAEGADLIEFDVALTKDGRAVLLHDDDLDRTTNFTGPIRERTLADLKGCNISAKFVRSTTGDQLKPVPNEGIPSLESVVEWSVKNNMKMLFDVKDYDTALVQIIAHLFEKYDLYDKGIVCSFFPWVVYRMKRQNQRILTGLTWRKMFFSYKDCENVKPRYEGVKQVLAEIVDCSYVFLLKTIIPRFLGADLLLTNNLDISKGFVDAQRAKGLHVAVWTVNDMAEMHWMLDYLQIPILTDHPYYTKKSTYLKQVMKNGYLPN